MQPDPAGLALQIVCSGTNGAVALEDAYVAGRIAARLPGPRTDAALVAEAVARAFPTAFDALSASADGGALIEADMVQDVADCALESKLEVVPIVVTASNGVAVLTSG